LIYNNCSLYKCTSKKMLKYYLRIADNTMLKQDYVLSNVRAYIAKDKPRLVEAPSDKLKAIQSKIQKILGQVTVPDYVFCGVKGRSYVDNARMHEGKGQYLYKVDLTTFFPSIKRETVYSFFKDELCCAQDIAEILANFTTVDLCRLGIDRQDTVWSFLAGKNIATHNHLITGSPVSPILSFLVNRKMFGALHTLAAQNDAIMSVYMDDVVFSSHCYLSRKFRIQVKQIISKYGYRHSSEKTRFYAKKTPKLVTGVVIDQTGTLTVKNCLRLKIITEHKKLRADPNDIQCRKRLQGLVTAARQVEKTAFPTIHKFAFGKPLK